MRHDVAMVNNAPTLVPQVRNESDDDEGKVVQKVTKLLDSTPCGEPGNEMPRKWRP